jgi:hypothetical protein
VSSTKPGIATRGKPEDLCQVAEAAYGIADPCIDAVLLLVQAAGRKVACRRGCGVCCDCYIPATFAEALPIARWLSDPLRQERLGTFWEQVSDVNHQEHSITANMQRGMKRCRGRMAFA